MSIVLKGMGDPQSIPTWGLGTGHLHYRPLRVSVAGASGPLGTTFKPGNVRQKGVVSCL